MPKQEIAPVKLTEKQLEALRAVANGKDIDGRVARGLTSRNMITKGGKVSAAGQKYLGDG